MLPKNPAICQEYKKCGKPGCKCNSGHLHGPYYYYFYRENGKLKRSYIRKADAEVLWENYLRRRQLQKHYADEREEYTDYSRELRRIDRMLAEVKSLLRGLT